MRVNLAYGVTDRHGAAEATRGLAENERFLRAGGRGMVGVHAAFTCRDETLAAAAELATELGVGVHIHVAEGSPTAMPGPGSSTWPPTTGCSSTACTSTGRCGARSPTTRGRNMNNSVGYAAPTTRSNRVVLGTDGIGADMLEEARLAYVRLREHDVTAVPDTVWSWLEEGYRFFPECRDDRVEFNYDHADSAWHTAFTPGVRAVDVTLGSGEVVVRDGRTDASRSRRGARPKLPSKPPDCSPTVKGLHSMTTPARHLSPRRPSDP